MPVVFFAGHLLCKLCWKELFRTIYYMIFSADFYRQKNYYPVDTPIPYIDKSPPHIDMIDDFETKRVEAFPKINLWRPRLTSPFPVIAQRGRSKMASLYYVVPTSKRSHMLFVWTASCFPSISLSAQQQQQTRPKVFLDCVERSIG